MKNDLEKQVLEVKSKLNDLVVMTHCDDIEIKVNTINRKLDELLSVFAQIKGNKIIA